MLLWGARTGGSNRTPACVTVALALLGSLALMACGEERPSPPAQERTGPTEAEDETTLRKMIVAYGATPGAKSCDFLSQEYLRTDYKGLEGCQRESKDANALRYKVERVSVKGNDAEVVILDEDGERYRYDMTREGVPSEAHAGWKILGETELKKGRGGGDEGQEERPEPKPKPSGGKPQEYVDCLKERGAKEVRLNPRRPPSVEFRAGKGLLFTQFRDSTRDAERTEAKAKRLGFAIQNGRIVVFATYTPPRDDLELATGCLTKIGL
jgi:hypothetical protein